MIEIPESGTMSSQVEQTLVNKKIIKVINATSPHKFAWSCGDPKTYGAILTGKQIHSSKGHGMFVDIYLDADTCITIGDGTNMRYLCLMKIGPISTSCT
jgi:formamidopyrimidine-DNA glycosylase